MAQQILILDKDKSFTQRLTTHLQKLGGFNVAVATTLSEAGQILGRVPQDLAFLPVEKDAGAVYSLRALQPDLRLVLMKPTSQTKVAEAYSGKVQGVLIKPLLEIDLATVLQEALAQPVWVNGKRATQPVEDTRQLSVDTAVILAILQQANFNQLVHTAVFAQGGQLVTFWGSLAESEAATVAVHAGTDYTSSTAQMQFVPLPPRYEEQLLYTEMIAPVYLLTLVAQPETPVRELRLRAQRLSSALREVLNGRLSLPPDMIQVDTGLLGRRKSFAIVWRPLRPLPKALVIPLRRSLERLAAANACVITHTSVQPDLVHLVVLCPPEKDSAWAVYLFKNGSETTIQQEYGAKATLWDTGHYAAESLSPLSEAELKIFLENKALG